MKTLWKFWDEFWFSRHDPLPAAVFRIATGIMMLTIFAASYPNWERFYGADGIISLNDPVPSGRSPLWWNIFYWTDGYLSIWTYWWISIAVALAFTVGWQTRLATFALFVLQSSMIFRNQVIVDGQDFVVRLLLFCGCFAPLGHCLSVDDWLRRRRLTALCASDNRALPMVWPVRLMQVHIALIYVFSTAAKIGGDEAWRNGMALYWVAANDTWSIGWSPWPFYAFGGYLSRVATYSALIIEAGFPFLVWFNSTRRVALVGIYLLHIGIGLLVPQVGYFTISMFVSFLIFVPAESWRKLGGRLLCEIRTWHFLRTRELKPTANSSRPCCNPRRTSSRAWSRFTISDRAKQTTAPATQSSLKPHFWDRQQMPWSTGPR